MITSSPRACFPLPDLAVVQFQGADALAFLQGQLSNDLVNMPPAQARLAAYCSAKGRTLATLVVWREPDEKSDTTGDTCCALVKADVAQALVKRLTMFVLRAKVNIAVAPRAVCAQVCTLDTENTPALPAWSLEHEKGATLIVAPCASSSPAVRRRWCIAPAQDADASPEPDISDASDPAAHARWNAADIAAGLPWIGAQNQDMYIPQTLNLDLIGAISFTKGCYPGQEVVARSHYRGTIKRRMMYATADVDPADVVGVDVQGAAVGADVFDARQPGAPCGRVINLAYADGVLHLLLEVQLADAGSADFRLGGEDGTQGAVLACQALPYAIPMPERAPAK